MQIILDKSMTACVRQVTGLKRFCDQQLQSVPGGPGRLPALRASDLPGWQVFASHLRTQFLALNSFMYIYPTGSVSLPEPWLIRALVPEVVLEEQNLKKEFSELVLDFLDWLLNAIRFKDTHDSIFSRKEHAGSPRYDVAIEICTAWPSDTIRNSMSGIQEIH